MAASLACTSGMLTGPAVRVSSRRPGSRASLGAPCARKLAASASRASLACVASTSRPHRVEAAQQDDTTGAQYELVCGEAGCQLRAEAAAELQQHRVQRNTAKRATAKHGHSDALAAQAAELATLTTAYGGRHASAIEAAARLTQSAALVESSTEAEESMGANPWLFAAGA